MRRPRRSNGGLLWLARLPARRPRPRHMSTLNARKARLPRSSSTRPRHDVAHYIYSRADHGSHSHRSRTRTISPSYKHTRDRYVHRPLPYRLALALFGSDRRSHTRRSHHHRRACSRVQPRRQLAT
jgi:hypothetical protein